MHFTKPAWVLHKDSAKTEQNPKRLSIFSVHVHPDGSRIATGGLDAKIRIWSTKPILSEASELSGKPPKSLCTLTMHTGPVLTVRWAHSGRWLASGSDDETVMVWDHDPWVCQGHCVSLLRRSVSTRRNARGKVWGTDEINVEGWKPLKRLQGHSSGSCVRLSKSCCTHTSLRCHRRCMVARRPIPCLSWSRLGSYGLVWLYTWYISHCSYLLFRWRI